MKIYLIAIFQIFIVNTALARCNGNYGDHLIKYRYDCGSDESNSSLLETLHKSEKYESTFNQVSLICSGGCYSAMFNAKLRPECDAQYAEAFSKAKFEVPTNCKDKGSFIKPAVTAAPATTGTAQNTKNPDDVCFWSSRSTIDMKCGLSTKDTNICGSGGRAICAGQIVCTERVESSGDVFEPGEYSMSCLSKSGYCDEKGKGPSISTCMKDNAVEIHDGETIKASGKSSLNSIISK